jgi:hypothetical protein
VSELTDDVIDVVLEQGAAMPSPMSAIHLHQMGGAVGRVGVGATAFSGRASAYTYNLVSTWTDVAEDATHIAANQRLAAALAPMSQPSTYVNFLTEATGDSDTPVRAAYGDEVYDRLARLKMEFNPTNMVHSNHNVRPER